MSMRRAGNLEISQELYSRNVSRIDFKASYIGMEPGQKCIIAIYRYRGKLDRNS